MAEAHPFSTDNVPFGVYSRNGSKPRCCTRINDDIVDLARLCEGRYLDLAEELQAALETAFGKPYLNDFAALGIATIRQARNAIQKTFSKSEQPADCAFRYDSDIKLHLPMKVAEYTDFLTSKEHSLNAAAVIFDGQPDRINVPPSFFTAPIGYHGRASSVVVSGTPIRRPRNVARDRQTGKLYYEPSKALDYEIELGLFLCKSNPMGEPVSLAEAENSIFGAVLLNDWSARDHQGFEMTPLGPFNGKNFGTSISPWIVTLDALRSSRSALPDREGEIAPHLDAPNQKGLDLTIEASINGKRVAKTYSKYLYFSPAQLLAHHSVGGCPMNVGDLLATGTISGADSETLGSLLESTRGGRKPLDLGDGSQRGYLLDGDVVVFSAVSSSGIGFGTCEGQILAAL